MKTTNKYVLRTKNAIKSDIERCKCVADVNCNNINWSTESMKARKKGIITKCPDYMSKSNTKALSTVIEYIIPKSDDV